MSNIWKVVTPNHDDIVVVQKRHKSIFIPHTLWGRKGTNMDIAKVMYEATKTEGALILELVDNLNEDTHESTLAPPTSKAHQVTRSRTLKTLIQKEYIKKIGQRKFLFNPFLLVPRQDVKDSVVLRWEKL
jgi:hypothetical protein